MCEIIPLADGKDARRAIIIDPYSGEVISPIRMETLDQLVKLYDDANQKGYSFSDMSQAPKKVVERYRGIVPGAENQGPSGLAIGNGSMWETSPEGKHRLLYIDIDGKLRYDSPTGESVQNKDTYRRLFDFYKGKQFDPKHVAAVERFRRYHAVNHASEVDKPPGKPTPPSTKPTDAGTDPPSGKKGDTFCENPESFICDDDKKSGPVQANLESHEAYYSFVQKKIPALPDYNTKDGSIDIHDKMSKYYKALESALPGVPFIIGEAELTRHQEALKAVIKGAGHLNDSTKNNYETRIGKTKLLSIQQYLEKINESESLDEPTKKRLLNRLSHSCGQDGLFRNAFHISLLGESLMVFCPGLLAYATVFESGTFNGKLDMDYLSSTILHELAHEVDGVDTERRQTPNGAELYDRVNPEYYNLRKCLIDNYMSEFDNYTPTSQGNGSDWGEDIKNNPLSAELKVNHKLGEAVADILAASARAKLYEEQKLSLDKVKDSLQKDYARFCEGRVYDPPKSSGENLREKGGGTRASDVPPTDDKKRQEFESSGLLEIVDLGSLAVEGEGTSEAEGDQDESDRLFKDYYTSLGGTHPPFRFRIHTLLGANPALRKLFNCGESKGKPYCDLDSVAIKSAGEFQP